MKKYLLGILLCAIALLAACGSNDEAQKSSANEGNKTNENANNEEASNEDVVSSEPTKVKEEPKIQQIQIGETIVVDDYAEMTVKNNVFGKVINPPNPGSFYSYYENKESDQIYFDTTIAIKSLLTSKKSSDEFVSVKIIYDDKYEYTSFATIEDKGGSDFTYPNITAIEPLQTGVLHFLASLPTEVESDSKPLKAIVTINGMEYEQIIR